MVEITPEGTPSAGGDETIVLTKAEHDAMVESIANGKQAESNMQKELIDLRKKNRDLATSGSPVQPEDVSKAVEAEFKKREAEEVKRTIEAVTAEFLSEHSEFSREEDTDGSKLAAFQKSLAQFNLSGIKTKEDYARVLNNALSLTPEVRPAASPIPGTPRGPASPIGNKSTVKLTETEGKLVHKSFGGDVEAYLKVKAKRPEYIDELLKYVR